VLAGLLDSTLARIAGAHVQRVAELTRHILSRVTGGPGVEKVRQSGLSIITGLYIWQAHALCSEILDGFVRTPNANAEVLGRMMFQLRDLVTHGCVNPPDPAADAIRQRALGLVARILKSTKRELRELEVAHAGVVFTTLAEAEQERVKRVVRLLDTIAKELYFASGAFANRGRNRCPGERVLNFEERKRFFEEAGPILDELGDAGFPSVAHSLLETLESFIPFNPRLVFLRTGRIVRAGTSGGYQFEQMAADLIVGLVERYLAEYRELLQEDKECRQVLVELLDTFIRAGWPGARQLTYRLEEIFR
jgi:hypothetical protein